MELCILAILFPTFGIRHTRKFLKFSKYLHDSIRHNSHTINSGLVSNPFKRSDISFLLVTQLPGNKMHSVVESVLAKYCCFSSRATASRSNNILGDDDHVRIARPTSRYDDLLLQRLDGLRKLFVAFPFACCLYFVDTASNGLDNIPCTFCHHVGDMCVALEGHDFSSHGLEEILDHLSGAMLIVPNMGETKG